MDSHKNVATQRILYENALKNSDSQDSRKNNIDSKVNYLITIAIALLVMIVEFINVDDVFEICNIDNIKTIIFTYVIYYITIIVAFVVVIKYILIFQAKKYRTIGAEHFVEENTKEMNEYELLEKLTDEYVKNAMNNAEVNDKQMKEVNNTTILLMIEVFLILLICIILKII